ncbi:tetraprenyl-beta-curcumene synthase family protein [Virgibacillus xinjiangensis]|uniref:Tetraprenyl-beta-curcumene synthase family protein n=1 Tax=Virgibacillus xinjiangensis TaxID=393090 RepID=A0ABV7CSG0_9BACI
MSKQVPTKALVLMKRVYQQVFPAVDRELTYWKRRALEIPDMELRSQALASMEAKRFHCQGGAVYSLLAGKEFEEAVRFIVAYQTISDYLDNLCDRSTSMDPADFRQLHQAMEDALVPGKETRNYYRYREEQDDGGYLAELAATCRHTVTHLDNYQMVKDYLLDLQCLYTDLQVHKHVAKQERVPRLTAWFHQHKTSFQGLDWYEFSAAAGSTLGVFSLVSYALSSHMDEEVAGKIYDGYFPYIQAVHIMLDYFIDQQEDEAEGDLNFCSYYEDQDRMKERFLFFIQQAESRSHSLPNPLFHQMVLEGLIGLYLGDPKVDELRNGPQMRRTLIKRGGWRSRFFYWNTALYYRLNGGKSG